ncbi:hypothetical protein OOJ09_31900 [Mesorhizobium qingshengii]|uniref:Uncharacterized protein n=1 Tax=Mesorhizobium qingshengii TaxID=1165689 RepID=A0ABT4R5E0_9HYPH|nr:hypothetical protein [Mesorhizobium qingshengii]MCZ8548773.1 hypothetical protein [Mesorhizobium qingshengii]
MDEVAADLGSSAGTIVAICRANDIPVPPPHYWRKIANGSPPKRRALPTDRLKRNQTVLIGDQVEPVINDQRLASLDAGSEQLLRVAVAVEVTDPVAAAIQKDLRRSSSAGEVRQRSGFIRVDIGLDSLPRAANLIASIKAAILERSWSVSVDAKRGAVVDGENVELALSERYASIPHTPTAADIRDYRSYGRPIPEHDQVRSGHLQLSITNATYLGVRQKWADGKRQRVEDVLTSFVDGIERAATALKQLRIEREERARKWAEEEKRQQERERLEAIDRVRGTIFKEQASAHQEALMLHGYIEAVKSRLARGSGQDVQTLGWIAWAENYVARKDPLNGELPVLLSEEDALRIRWQYPDR